jgi:hypothetical protein
MNPKPDKLLPAIYGGIIMGLLSEIPFVNLINCLCCAGLIIGGLMAVFFYKSNFTPDTVPFTAGDCLSVGALSGVFGALTATVLSLIISAMFGDVMMEFLRNWIENSNIKLPDQVREQFYEALETESSSVSFVTNFFFSIIIFPLFGLLGGLIGYGIFKPNQQLMPPPPPPVPQSF